jgi:aspartate/methionine/tyrosine aminotransferase
MKNPLDRFELRPIKVAKVSEISESTAASNVPFSSRVNFHIGNPVQDNRLNNLYLNLISDSENADQVVENISLDDSDTTINQEYLLLLKNCIRKCSPYMPRGGYALNSPGELVEQFKEWLTSGQSEALDYDFGESSGQREVIISNGGIWENLRVLFFLISKYLIHLPVKVLLYEVDLPSHLNIFPSIEIESLPENEIQALDFIKEHFLRSPDRATFMLLGTVASERTRRELRNISLKQPLFFIEINDALNHLSIQREAKMLNRVLRILTPSAISPKLSEISVNFIAGNADFIRVLESVQFELKGTPAAAEVELLSYLLKNGKSKPSNGDFNSAPDTENNWDFTSRFSNNFETNLNNVYNLVDRVCTKISQTSVYIDNFLQTYSKYGYQLNNKIQSLSIIPGVATDKLALLNTSELLSYFLSNISQESISEELGESFLSVFLNHHIEYDIKNCFVVSGSARTALSLLGYHCGIEEVITVDLSWTYEHCFPVTETVSLSDDLSLDCAGIIRTIEKKLSQNPDWKQKGTVVFNNPHNASGQIFNEENISILLQWLLEKDFYVIDDLSYQNVLPEQSLNGPKTLKQIVNQLVSNGYLLKEQTKNLITVHSLSKTDCFAGARLAVVEILHPELSDKFREINAGIKPNNMAILIAYLFYRNHPEQVNQYWMLRNQIFNERMQALEEACTNLPNERNPFEIEIHQPAGSMYPQMTIKKLPHGISLDWLSSGLATKGIGLIPLTVFARTAKGYELARKTFRLTLGGETNPEELKRKTRRVLIDLNRMIADEEANYNKRNLDLSKNYIKQSKYIENKNHRWQKFSDNLISVSIQLPVKKFKGFFNHTDEKNHFIEFIQNFIPERLEVFRQRFSDKAELVENIISIAKSDKRFQLINVLQNELYKDNLQSRTERFRQRIYDRTVHPTQMYALNVELIFNRILDQLLQDGELNTNLTHQAIFALADEFLGLNVPINSVEEADELVADLKMIIQAEEYTRLNLQNSSIPFLSFWGDWDGSTRPSGQGHRLVMAVLIENVNCLAKLLMSLMSFDPTIKIEQDILNELSRLKVNNRRSLQLSNKINALTNELEKRYFKVLPIDEKVNRLRQIGQRAGFIKDPISALWQHNDRLEKKMLDLRNQRSKTMEFYFALNKRLRKKLYSLLPQIEKNLHTTELALQFGSYHDLLKRFVLTPRIHQKIITSTDQFTIDTTLQNIVEINRISGNYGNPGMVLALQVSMTTEPESIIDLDRKSRAKREQCLRDNPECALPFLGLIPLFEDSQTVSNIETFLDKLWEYSIQSRRIDQDTNERFSDLIAEVFIAGSDLSQQVGQPASLALFKEAKFSAIRWFAERGLVEKIRVKLGSGEPAQRQGGYYDSSSGERAFLTSKDAKDRLIKTIKEAACKSTQYAKSPLRGVLSGGDLRTFQSTISEKIRMLSMEERAQLLHHVRESQKFHSDEISRASEPLLDTRLQYKNQGVQELETITQKKQDEFYNQFLKISTRNFRDILYGRDEDVIGLHIISYFISRSIPTLRDRPTIRPSREMSHDRGQKIIERIARTLPLSHYGSLLRAIGHNRAQTMVLGINQLSTGLFRAFTEFIQAQKNYNDGISLISDRILPNLPVHELLHTLRIYHNPDLHYIKRLENTFPAGNSSFVLLREDNDAINNLTVLLQKELLRRFGLDVTDFFNSAGFLPQLLPSLRPDLAILLQPDLFNTDVNKLTARIDGKIDKKWIQQIEFLLEIPLQIHSFRERIWELIEDPTYQQIESFIHLSLAIYKVYKGTGSADMVFATEPGKVMRLSSEVKELLRRNKDDSMRQFLIAAVHYLTKLPETMSEIPIDIIRTLRDVERIVKIEEQAFTKKEQDLIRFYILQIARLCGENG